MMLVVWIVQLMQVYAMIGVVFAIAFVTRGAGRIDPVAHEGTWGFRALIIPGAAALWPILLSRWIAAARSSSHESERAGS